MNAMFETKHLQLIRLMDENSVTVENQTYCPLSQTDISKSLNVSRPVISRMMDELTQGGYVEKLARGKTQLTQKGKNVIETLRKL